MEQLSQFVRQIPWFRNEPILSNLLRAPLKLLSVFVLRDAERYGSD